MLNEDVATRTLTEGVCLLFNGLDLLLLYFGEMIILHGNLLYFIHDKRRIEEKRVEEWLNENARQFSHQKVDQMNEQYLHLPAHHHQAAHHHQGT